MRVKKQQLEPCMEQLIGSRWERSMTGLSAVILFNLYAEHIMRNARLDELQAEIKTAGRNINTLRYVDNTPLMAENKEELKTHSMMVKQKSESSSLKLNIKKTKIMVTGYIVLSHSVMYDSLQPHAP